MFMGIRRSGDPELGGQEILDAIHVPDIPITGFPNHG